MHDGFRLHGLASLVDRHGITSRSETSIKDVRKAGCNLAHPGTNDYQACCVKAVRFVPTRRWLEAHDPSSIDDILGTALAGRDRKAQLAVVGTLLAAGDALVEKAEASPKVSPETPFRVGRVFRTETRGRQKVAIRGGYGDGSPSPMLTGKRSTLSMGQGHLLDTQEGHSFVG